MILKFKKSIVIINFFILIIQLLFNSLSIADEKKEQPSVTTKQYRDWTFRCVEIKKKMTVKLFKLCRLIILI